MNNHGVSTWTSLLGTEHRILGEYTVPNEAKTIFETVESPCRATSKYDISEIKEDHWRITPQDCGDADNNASPNYWNIEDYNLRIGPKTLSAAATEAAITATNPNTKTNAKMS